MVKYLQDLLVDKPKPKRKRAPKKAVAVSKPYLGKNPRKTGPRTRVLWSPQKCESAVTYKQGFVTNVYPDPPSYPTRRYERIHDNVGPLVRNKPVQHVYHVKIGLIGQGTFNGGASASTPGGWTGSGNRLVGMDPHLADTALVPKLYEDASLYTEWGNACFTQFTTQVPVQMDLINSIRELPDAVDMVNGFMDILTRLNTSVSVLRRSGKFTKSLTLGDLANTKLAYEFGIKPMLEDVRALVNMNKRVNDQLTFLQSSRLRPTKLNFTRKRELLTPFDKALPGITNNFEEKHACVALTTIMHAQATLHHDLKGLDSELAFYRVLLGSTGILHVPSTVWNAIPLSFVVDWFLRIGDKLDNHHVRPFEGHWRLTNQCYSIKDEAKLETWHRWHPELGNPWRLAASWAFKRYARWPGSPPVSPVTFNGSLTSSQQVLAAALALQRVVR